jgi:replicative DNA helicase
LTTLQQWGEVTRDLLDSQEQFDWSTKHSKILTGFEKLDDITEGLDTGFCLVAGYYAVGKSTFMTQMGLQMLKANENVYWLCFSIDDSKRLQVLRTVANLAGMRINDIRRPYDINDEVALQSRANTYLAMKETYANRLRIYDQSDGIGDLPGNSLKAISGRIRADFTAISEATDGRPVMLVTIDSFYNIAPDESGLWGSPTAKTEYIGKMLKELLHLEVEGVDVLPIIMCTAHLRKDTRKPTMDSIKDSIGPSYDSDLALLCYCDVMANDANAQVFHKIPGTDEKQPVLEVRVGKNKYSEKLGYIYYRFFKGRTSFSEETNPEQAKIWSTKSV